SLSPVLGQNVVLTASVTARSPGAGTPTGTVTFLDGGTSWQLVLRGDGLATFSTSGLGVGGHSIRAVYSGDSNFLASNSVTTVLTVNRAATITSVTALGNPSVFGQTVTLTATVSGGGLGAGSLTGMVTFKDGSITLAAVQLNARSGNSSA